ncbi:hypothetical protein C8Q76DRAFT_415232 [Earliella scabrosa]|nr:hypothetical protein C8Q76DRAFT_415232 [Earliella scabrosa]
MTSHHAIRTAGQALVEHEYLPRPKPLRAARESPGSLNLRTPIGASWRAVRWTRTPAALPSPATRRTVVFAIAKGSAMAPCLVPRRPRRRRSRRGRVARMRGASFGAAGPSIAMHQDSLARYRRRRRLRRPWVCASQVYMAGVTWVDLPGERHPSISPAHPVPLQRIVPSRASRAVPAPTVGPWISASKICHVTARDSASGALRSQRIQEARRLPMLARGSGLSTIIPFRSSTYGF